MKKEENNLIEKQLMEKKKLPDDVKKEVNKNVFRNLFTGIIVLLYFIFINLGYYNIASNVFMTDIKIFSICLIAITVILFEKAYNESNAKYGVHGIETLVVSIITLYMQYVYFYQKEKFIKIYMTIPVFFSMYYVIKSIGITLRAKRKYFNSRSDVKDIIKKEKKKIEDDEIIEDKEKIEEEEKIKENEVIEKKETKPKTTRTAKSTKTSDTKKVTRKTTTSKKKVEVQDNEETKTADTKKTNTTTKTRTTSSRKKTDLQENEETKITEPKKTKATKPKTTTKKTTTTKKETTPKEKTTTTKRTATRTKKED